MNVADHDFVCAFILLLDLSHAEGDVATVIGDELEPATLDDFSDALVELESRCWIALDLYSDVASLICHTVQFLNSLTNVRKKMVKTVLMEEEVLT